ncbi:hypothetical protein ACFU6I_21815 [Streptomyces sp. NPDC057486]|uniref:hypothetical protein n=1 Tax=Streptomyces sp. NPDC057486 TaxID=3346145 RepID=UPI0036912499
MGWCYQLHDRDHHTERGADRERVHHRGLMGHRRAPVQVADALGAGLVDALARVQRGEQRHLLG